MSRPPINPEKTTAGIALDPQTLERVIPESRRPDGTLRKQIKIRPGFTPQEDVRRFRGTKQAQMDVNTLPKGHIIGWAPPPTSTAASGSNGTKPLSKSAKKNAKRKEKREKDKEAVPDNWDDEDEGSPKDDAPSRPVSTSANESNQPSPAVVSDTEAVSKEAGDAGLASELEKLSVK